MIYTVLQYKIKICRVWFLQRLNFYQMYHQNIDKIR